LTAFLILAYAATIPLANFLIGRVGTVCGPDGPCLIPVFPGVLAPSGVLVIGAALVLRDLVQRRAGIPASLACVVGGAVLSAAVAPPALVVASAAAFLFSELADFSVYTPLARRSFALGVAASCAAGALVDSGLFLWLAFGSLDHLEGQVVGKVYAALAFLAWRVLARANLAGAFRGLGRRKERAWVETPD
jgi:queuosine precursor transporter